MGEAQEHVEAAKRKLEQAAEPIVGESRGLRVDLVEQLYRAAAALEHADQRIRVQLVAKELIDDLAGEWSPAVTYRFKEDPSHAGVVFMELRYINA